MASSWTSDDVKLLNVLLDATSKSDPERFKNISSLIGKNEEEVKKRVTGGGSSLLPREVVAMSAEEVRSAARNGLDVTRQTCLLCHLPYLMDQPEASSIFRPEAMEMARKMLKKIHYYGPALTVEEFQRFGMPEQR